MRVTGIITCRNYADLVGGAIGSFAGQDYEPKRLVVVDDGSADQSWDVIRRAAAGTPPCRLDVFHLDAPQGPAFAKNLAIEQAWDDTDAFAFLDADDAYEPGKLSRSVDLLRDPYGHPGLVYSDYSVIDDTRSIRHDCILPGFSAEALRDGKVADGNWVVTREVIQATGRFDTGFRVAENFDFMLRSSRKFMLIHIPEPLVTVRITNRSLRTSLPASDWAYHRHRAIAKHGKTA